MHYFDGSFGKSGATVRKAFQPRWMRKSHQRLAPQQLQPWLISGVKYPDGIQMDPNMVPFFGGAGRDIYIYIFTYIYIDIFIYTYTYIYIYVISSYIIYPIPIISIRSPKMIFGLQLRVVFVFFFDGQGQRLLRVSPSAARYDLGLGAKTHQVT